MYDTLAKIYEEWYEMFKFDTFHMGADEIHFGCWNSSQLITETMKASNIETNKEGRGALSRFHYCLKHTFPGTDSLAL